MTYKRVRRARGTTAVVDAYVGPVGELVIDTDLLEIRLQNGVAGGLRVPRFGGPAVFSTLQTTGNTTLGDAAGDTVTINGTAVSIPNGLNFDSNKLVIDAANNFVGIGTNTPARSLTVYQATSAFVQLANATTGVTQADGGYISQQGLQTIIANREASDLILATSDIARLTIDSAGNAGLGVTPSAWRAPDKALQVRQTVIHDINNTSSAFGQNYYLDSGNIYRYIKDGFASFAILNGGDVGRFEWHTAPSGTAGNPITFTQAMTLTLGGNLLVGTTIPFAKFAVQGDAYIGGGNDLSVGNVNNTNAASINSDSLDNSAALVFKTAAAGLARTEAARITSARYFKASNTGTYGGVAGVGDLSASSDHVIQNSAEASYTLRVVTASSNSSTSIVSLLPTGATGFHYQGLLNNSEVYRVLANGNVQNTNNSYGAISDIKLKDIIGPKESTWDKTKNYEWIEYTLKNDPTKRKLLGLSAQQARTVSPGVVLESPDLVDVVKTRTIEVPAVLDEEGNEIEPATTREEEYTEKEPNGEVTLSVVYSVVAMQYNRTVQEAQLRIEALESENTALKATLDLVLQRLTALEAK